MFCDLSESICQSEQRIDPTFAHVFTRRTVEAQAEFASLSLEEQSRRLNAIYSFITAMNTISARRQTEVTLLAS